MFSLNDSMRYLLYNKPTDMRKSYHTLCGLVTNELGCDPCNGDVYIFINKARNRIKLLHWGRAVWSCTASFLNPRPSASPPVWRRMPSAGG